MRTQEWKNELLAVCRRFSHSGEGVEVEEPYIPFVPEDWNNILLLSEAQNLSGSYDSYVESIQNATDEVKWLRLYPEARKTLYGVSQNIGVGPWDDGVLKLAASSVWGHQPERFAVGNAVLWSAANGRKNVRPSQQARELSSAIWAEFLAILRPRIVVAVGKIAREVIESARGRLEGQAVCVVRWISASPSAQPHIARSWQTEAVRNWRSHIDETRRSLGPVRVEAEERAARYACYAVAITPPELRSVGSS